MTYDELDLVKNFQCQNHNVILGIFEVLLKETKAKFSFSYMDQ
jgi:hypothetical protein